MVDIVAIEIPAGGAILSRVSMPKFQAFPIMSFADRW
jgi:hypothetical protein